MPVFYGMLAFSRLFENGNAAIFKVKSSVQSRFVKSMAIWSIQSTVSQCWLRGKGNPISLFGLCASYSHNYFKEPQWLTLLVFFATVWGVQNVETKNIRVVIIHKDLKDTSNIDLQIKLDNPNAYEVSAVVLRLTAPSQDAKSGVCTDVHEPSLRCMWDVPPLSLPL